MNGTHNTRHKVWLHIGMPKTGTTSIQAVMFSNRKLLREHGYLYPDFGERQHVALARELARRAGSRVPFPTSGDPGPWRRFSELLEAQPVSAHTSIVSSENFFQRPACIPGHCGVHTEHGFELLKGTIAETAEYFSGCDVTVLAWLRRQDNWLMSMYNETVKTSHYARGFNAFAENSIGARLHQIMRLWIDAFGRERVVCRSYDALVKRKGNIVDSFLETVCPDIPRAAFRKTEEARNPSLSAEALWLKKRINALLQGQDAKPGEAAQARIRRLLVEVTATSPDLRAPFASAMERRTLMERHLEENRSLVKELGYAELRPLIELDDLETQAAPPGELKLSGHAVDQMIRSLLLEESGAEQGTDKQAGAAGRRSAP